MPVPINFTEFVPPLIVPAFLTVPEPAILTPSMPLMPPLIVAPVAFVTSNDAGLDARLAARDRAAAHIVHGGIGGEDGCAVRARGFDPAGVGGDVYGIGTNGKGGKACDLAADAIVDDNGVTRNGGVTQCLDPAGIGDVRSA